MSLQLLLIASQHFSSSPSCILPAVHPATAITSSLSLRCCVFGSAPLSCHSVPYTQPRFSLHLCTTELLSFLTLPELLCVLAISLSPLTTLSPSYVHLLLSPRPPPRTNHFTSCITIVPRPVQPTGPPPATPMVPVTLEWVAVGGAPIESFWEAMAAGACGRGHG